jgi:hypothetical protein
VSARGSSYDASFHSPPDDEDAVAERFESVADMPAVRVRPLRRPEYDLLVDQGAFTPDERIQLLEGELVEMSLRWELGTPYSSRHRTSG